VNDAEETLMSEKSRRPVIVEYETDLHNTEQEPLLENSGIEGNTSSAGTKTVGTRSVNLLGIFDMTGNAWKWCLD